MEEKRKKAVQTEEKVVLNDYEFSPVPDAKKHTWRDQVFVWLGVGFCLTAFTLGGQIALGLGFWPTVAAGGVGGGGFEGCRTGERDRRPKRSFLHGVLPVHIRHLRSDHLRLNQRFLQLRLVRLSVHVFRQQRHQHVPAGG